MLIFRLIIRHPENGSAMESWLVQTRDVVAKEFGMDDSYLYPPHVSMSGWVQTSHKKMDAVVSRLKEIIQERLTKLLNDEKRNGGASTLSTVATQDTLSTPVGNGTAKSKDSAGKEETTGHGASSAAAASDKAAAAKPAAVEEKFP